MSTQPLWMSVAETKKTFGYSHTTVYREINAGLIEAVKRGRSTLIYRPSVERRQAELPRLGKQAV